MTNGKIDDAKIEALLHGSQNDRDRYLLTCAVETRRAIENVPDLVAEAIEEQRRKDFRIVSLMAGGVAAIISLITPYILRLF